MRFLYTFLLCFSISLSSFAQGQSSNDTTEVAFTPNKNPEVTAVKIPDGSITLDGELNEEVWTSCGKVSNFTEIAPRDNVKPDVETIGYIAYDNDNVYFAFICYDDMSTIRANMTDRDNMYQDDWIGPFIDTYNNQKEAFEFYVTPYGIQGDLIWTPNYEDSSPDFIFYSEAKMYKDRWTVEMKIPFKSLRFPEKDVQTWRVHLLRNRQRANRERIYWSSVSRDDPSFLGQAGFIKGIKGIKGGKQLEVLPYVIGNNLQELESRASDSKLGKSNFDGDFGFNIKYGISSNIIADATFNPDFSQIEADAPQIDINNPFALSFPEKRPFFLEGISSFRLPLNMVYTRSINNPLFAAKTTGKVGKFDIGYMMAYDENSPFIVPMEERSFVLQSKKKSLSNILRVKYDLGGENHIGAIFTDRETSKDTTLNFDFTGYNRNFGIDYKFNFSKNYYFGGQVTAFTNREISDTSFFNNQSRFDDGKHTAAFDGESYSGIGNYMFFERSAENWGFFTEYNYVPSTWRRDVGFLTRSNYHIGYMYQTYNFYPEGKLFQRINPDLTGYIRYNTDGIINEQYFFPGGTIEFKHGTRVWGNYFLLNNEKYGGVQHKDVLRWNIGAENYSLNQISGGAFYERGKYIVRFATPSYVGHGQNFNIWATIKPLDRLITDFNYNYSDLAKSSGGEMLFAGWTLDNTTRYQFNKNLFARLIVQYSSFDKSFRIDPMISYKWNPFTVLYIGSTHSLEEFDDTQNPGKQVLKESSRQIFIKFQYLWQL